MINSKTDPEYIDEEEKNIMEAFDRGEFQEVPNLEASKKEHEEAARNTLERISMAELRENHETMIYRNGGECKGICIYCKKP